MTWNLNDIWPEDKFEELLAIAEKDIEEIDKWWNRLEPTMKTAEFKEYLLWSEEVDERFSRLGHIPMLREAIDQKDAEARLMKTKVENLILRFNQKGRRISHWLKGLPTEGKKTLDDDNAKRLFAAIPSLSYGLNYTRLAAKHTLSQAEEEIIENKDMALGQAVHDLRGLVEADFIYQVGKKKIKTQGEVAALFHSPSAKLREQAYKALLKKHKENSDKFFVTYQAVVRDWGFETKRRKYSSPMGMRNFGNQLPDEAIETLLRVCKEERGVFQKYFEYKAKILRTKQLKRFDLYAPLNDKRATIKDKRINFEEAKKLVLDSFTDFSLKFAGYAKQVIDEGHIDWEPKRNKRSGAFCSTICPKVTPYVMLNHTDSPRDISTLAHELGHAVHSLYANKQYPSVQHANLPLAETASTLAEIILFEKMLDKEKDKTVKQQMLSDKIADSYATILRQAYFEIFEIEAHKLVAAGTTEAELSKRWLTGLKEQFGKSVKVDNLFKYEWMYVSHIFESPFYCYAYSFGELLALSLYSRYKKEGIAFVAKIEKLLESGGAEEPDKVLKEIGVDMRDENFWRGGFSLLREWEEQLFAATV